MKWRFLDTGKGNAFFNMALDEVFLKSISGRGTSPVFRLYEWEPSAITLGYAQEAVNILNLEKCRENGIDVTRRITGGRAVLHDKEIAYSVIAVKDDNLFGKNIMDTYSVICNALLEAFRAIGINADYEKGTSKGEISFGSASPCFQSVSKYEITLHGAKFVGSAQRRFRNVFIQQGSILYGPGQEKIIEYSVDSALHRNKNVIQEPIDLENEIKDFNLNKLKTALFKSFGNLVENYDYSIPEKYEIDETSSLINKKYSSKGWVLKNGD